MTELRQRCLALANHVQQQPSATTMCTEPKWRQPDAKLELPGVTAEHVHLFWPILTACISLYDDMQGAYTSLGSAKGEAPACQLCRLEMTLPELQAHTTSQLSGQCVLVTSSWAADSLTAMHRDMQLLKQFWRPSGLVKWH